MTAAPIDIDVLLDNHTPYTRPDGTQFCEFDGYPWKCETAQLAEEIRRLRGLTT